MIIWIKFAHSCPFYFTDSEDIHVRSCHLLFGQFQFTLIHGLNIPDSYAVLFFTALNLTFTNRHNWASFLLWPSCFILFGVISNCPLFFPSSILDTFQPGRLILQCHNFLSFYTVHEVLMASIVGWFAIPSSSGSHFVRTFHYDPYVLGGPTWHCS